MTAPPQVSFDFLPFDQVISRALSAHAANGLYAGFGIIGLGFLLNVVREIWRDVQGRTTSYSRHVVMLVAFLALLPAYQSIVIKIVQILSQLGDTFVGANRLDVAYLQRVSNFLKYDATLARSDLQAATSITSRPALVDALTFFCAQTACFAALYMAVFLKTIQIYMLSAVITAGPVLLGVCTLGQFFHPLAGAWLATLIEVSFWSFAMDILNYTLAPVSTIAPAEFSTINELMLAVTIISVMAAIPKVCRKLLRFEENFFSSPTGTMAEEAAVSGGRTVIRSTRIGSSMAPPPPLSPRRGLER